VRATRALQADLIWVNSYSMILREDMPATARLGGVNIHASLLPRNRGCNPIQWGIIHGEMEGGVTLHEITAGVDEGPIIEQRRVPIDITDDWLVVRDRIAVATDELIATNLTRILEGAWSSLAQDVARASYGRRRKAEDGRFDWTMPVIDIHNQIRALLPPLSPAFHVYAADYRMPMTDRLTPHALTSLKYGPVGGNHHAV
jgi:methionyl-tRNA formyltransferase